MNFTVQHRPGMIKPWIAKLHEDGRADHDVILIYAESEEVARWAAEAVIGERGRGEPKRSWWPWRKAET